MTEPSPSEDLQTLPLADLKNRAGSGDAAAQAVLGERHLTGRDAPFSPQAGLSLLTSASEAGEATAPRRLATLFGMGAGVPQSWTKAIDYLSLACARGEPRAQDELRLLAAGPLGTPEAERRDWAALARTVDIPLWTTAPAREPLRERPRIRRVSAFLGSEACAWIISIGAKRVAPALVYDASTGRGRVHEARSNSAYELSILDLDLVTVLLRARLASALGVPVGAMEPPQILRYEPGQKFDLHVDFLDRAQPGFAKDLDLRGQRILTALVYLNDDYDGGETDFPRAGLAFKATAGDALLFANLDRSGAPDPLTVHAGRPTSRGEKWVFSQWIRDRIAPAA